MTITDRLRDERGLTLIELMISMGVLMIIIVPITTSFLLGILQSTGAQARTADSSGAQLVSSYLLADIQSSQTVAASGSGCPSAATGTVKMQLTWSDVDPAGAHNIVVAYVDQPGSQAGQRELYRYACSSGTETNTLLALNLDTSTFAVTCKDAAGTTVSCATPPRSVSVHMEASSIEPQAKSGYEPFVLDFAATRRVGS